MPLNLEQKKEIVRIVSEKARTSISAIVVEYRGTTVEEMTKLRIEVRKKDMFLKVVPNNLAKRAFEGTDFSCLEKALVGPVLLIFSTEEPGAPAKLIKEFSKANEKLKAKAIAIGSQYYAANDLDRIANMPNRNEALSQLVSVMQAPISKFVRTLAEPQAKFVRLLAAIKDKKSS